MGDGHGWVENMEYTHVIVQVSWMNKMVSFNYPNLKQPLKYIWPGKCNTDPSKEWFPLRGISIIVRLL